MSSLESEVTAIVPESPPAALDRFHDECGLMAVWNHAEAANICYLGLYAQQHRGQEGAGVVALERGEQSNFNVHKGLGLVADVFAGFDFGQLPGRSAIGHVRYSTAGGNQIANVQPLFAEIAGGHLAIAHNGNLINADKLREELIAEGAIFSATSDTELLLHLVARTSVKEPFVERLIASFRRMVGAYSFVVMNGEKLYALRDPNGLRPLVLGELHGGLVVASETCAFDLVGARYIRDIEPGEVVEISGEQEVRSYFPFGAAKPSPCVFEYVYFARPDSTVFGRNVYAVRKGLGVELAREHPVPADIVIPVPDSGVSAALGYAQESKLPLELGLIRNHYVGRTFIEPKQSIRDFGVKIKLNANSAILVGKRIVVVDDSLVRGTTSRKLVAMLRQAGAAEIHLRISAPPTVDPCFYGIDTPQKDELIAAHQRKEQIQSFIGVDSLEYLSIDGLYRAVDRGEGDQAERDRVAGTPRGPNASDPPPRSKGKFCDACFSGVYPIGTPQQFERRQRTLFPAPKARYTER